jgi:hypothetical protein
LRKEQTIKLDREGCIAKNLQQGFVGFCGKFAYLLILIPFMVLKIYFWKTILDNGKFGEMGQIMRLNFFKYMLIFFWVFTYCENISRLSLSQSVFRSIMLVMNTETLSQSRKYG